MKIKRIVGICSLLFVCISVVIIFLLPKEAIRGKLILDANGTCYILEENGKLGRVHFAENVWIFSNEGKICAEDLKTGDFIVVYLWSDLLEINPYLLKGVRFAFVKRGELEKEYEYESMHEYIHDYLR